MSKTTVSLICFTLFFLSFTTYSQSTMNNLTSHSVEIIRYTIASDQQAQFISSYEQAGLVLRKSPYCLGYEMLHGVDEPQHFVIRIHWTSVDDHLKGFRNSEEFRAFFQLVKPYYNAIEEMKHYENTVVNWERK